MQTDAQLIRKIKKKHNKEAANELVNRYYMDIYEYVFRQVGDKENAMDLTQEIFILILQNIQTFDEKKASFRTWAHRISSNKVIDFYRSSYYRTRTKECSLYDEDSEEDIVELIPSKEMDISDIIINRELIKIVMKIVAGYKSEWIQIFKLKCFEEMTFEEIAGELGISEGTVKTRYYNMVKKIKMEVELHEYR